jgi:hypothetical protein
VGRTLLLRRAVFPPSLAVGASQSPAIRVPYSYPRGESRLVREDIMTSSVISAKSG